MKLKQLVGAAIAAVSTAITVPAFASGISAPDLTPVTDALTGVGLVGAAVFGVVVLIKGFHWVRRAL